MPKIFVVFPSSSSAGSCRGVRRHGAWGRKGRQRGRLPLGREAKRPSGAGVGGWQEIVPVPQRSPSSCSALAFGRVCGAAEGEQPSSLWHSPREPAAPSAVGSSGRGGGCFCNSKRGPGEQGHASGSARRGVQGNAAPRGSLAPAAPGDAQGQGPQPADVPSSSTVCAGTRAGSRTSAPSAARVSQSSHGTGRSQGRTHPPSYGVGPGEGSSGHTAPCAQLPAPSTPLSGEKRPPPESAAKDGNEEYLDLG